MTTDSSTPPRRVRVTSPRTAASRPRRVPVTSEIDAQTRLGEVYMSSLMRTQLRLAGTVLLTLALTVGAIPLVWWLFPELDDVHVFGMPLAWGLLGFAVYPALVTLGWFYVRAAERTERTFTEMVERE